MRWWRSWIPKSSLLVATLAALTVLMTAFALSRVTDSAVSIEVEITADQEGIAELFVNGDEQWQQQIVGPGRRTITFTSIEGPLDAIRVDPLAIAGERVTIHRITVRNSKGLELATFAGLQFATWVTYNAEDVVVDADGMTLTTANADTSVTSAAAIVTSERSFILKTLTQRWRQSFPATELVLGLPILFLAADSVIRRRWSSIALAIGPLALYLAIQVAGSTHGVTPADRAFGAPGFSDLDASYPRRLLLVISVLVVLFSAGALLASRQFPRVRRVTSATPPDRTEAAGAAPGEVVADASLRPSQRSRALQRLRQVQWLQVAIVATVPMLYALIRIPSAEDVSAGLTAPISSRDWDYANLRTWDHLLATGARPMVDFWYPYGNLGLFRMGIVGAVLTWLTSTLCLLAISSSLWRYARRATPVIVGTAAVAALDMQFYTGGPRYLIPLAAAVWFAVTRRSPGVERWLARGAVALTPLLALDVGVYTLMAVVAAVVADELCVRGLGDTTMRRRLLHEGIVVASGLFLFVIIGLIRGSLGPTTQFILDEQTTSAYVGAITPIERSMSEEPNRILYVFPFAALGIALYGALRRNGRHLGLSTVPVFGALGSYGVLLLAKHLIRPGLQGQLAMVCAAALAVAIAFNWRKIDRSFNAIAAGAMVGALLVQAQTGDSLELWRRNLRHAPERAVELLASFTWEREGKVLFRPTVTRERMVEYPEEIAVADAVAELRPDARIYVLGDAQYLYPLTDSAPYWTIANWDTSPFETQRRVMDELEADPPEVIVFDPRDFEFDAIPSELRVPLVYGWVVQNYRLEETVGPYDLLIPRGSSDIDWSYWRDRLGTTLLMGRLPAATTASGGSCTLDADDKHCLAYLRIEVAPVEENTVRTITLSGPTGFFKLTFLQQPGDTELTIPVGRMWFWDSATNFFVPTDWVLAHELIGARDSVLY